MWPGLEPPVSAYPTMTSVSVYPDIMSSMKFSFIKGKRVRSFSQNHIVVAFSSVAIPRRKEKQCIIKANLQ